VNKDSKYRSRKWLALIIIIALSTILLVKAFITGAQWVDIVMWVYGLFVTGNVAAVGVNKYKVKNEIVSS